MVLLFHMVLLMIGAKIHNGTCIPYTPSIQDLRVPSFYINVSNFYEYLGHPKSKFQNALRNARVEIGVYLLYTKFSIFQCRFDTKFFRIFGPVFTVKFKIYHLNSTNLFTGLGFSTYPFLW